MQSKFYLDTRAWSRPRLGGIQAALAPLQKNSIATLFNGAAPLSPFLLSHWHTVLFMEAAELGLGGSVGSALQWHYSDRAGAGGNPPKQAPGIGFSIKQTKGCTRAAACSQLTVSTNCWAGPAAAGSSSGTAPPSCCTPPCRPVAAAKRFVRVSSHPRHRLRVPAPC